MISTFNNFQATLLHPTFMTLTTEISYSFSLKLTSISCQIKVLFVSLQYCSVVPVPSIPKPFTRNTNLFSMHQVFCQLHFFLGKSPSRTSLLLLPQGTHSVPSVHRTLRAFQVTVIMRFPLPLSYFLDPLFLSVSSLKFLIWLHQVLVEAQGIFCCGMMESSS